MIQKKKQLDLNLHVPESKHHHTTKSKLLRTHNQTAFLMDKNHIMTSNHHPNQPPTNHPTTSHFLWAYPTGPCMPAGRPGAAPGGKAGREGLKFYIKHVHVTPPPNGNLRLILA